MAKQLNKNKIGIIKSTKKIETNNKIKKVQAIKKNTSKRLITTVGKDKTNSEGNLKKSEKKRWRKNPF